MVKKQQLNRWQFPELEHERKNRPPVFLPLPLHYLWGAGQGLARWLARVKALATEPKDLRLVPGSHIVEGASQLLQVVLCPPHVHSGDTLIPIRTNECKKKMLLTELKSVKSSINALYIKNSRKLSICVYVDTFKFNKSMPGLHKHTGLGLTLRLLTA